MRSTALKKLMIDASVATKLERAALKRRKTVSALLDEMLDAAEAVEQRTN